MVRGRIVDEGSKADSASSRPSSLKRRLIPLHHRRSSTPYQDIRKGEFERLDDAAWRELVDVHLCGQAHHAAGGAGAPPTPPRPRHADDAGAGSSRQQQQHHHKRPTIRVAPTNREGELALTVEFARDGLVAQIGRLQRTRASPATGGGAGGAGAGGAGDTALGLVAPPSAADFRASVRSQAVGGGGSQYYEHPQHQQHQLVLSALVMGALRQASRSDADQRAAVAALERQSAELRRELARAARRLEREAAGGGGRRRAERLGALRAAALLEQRSERLRDARGAAAEAAARADAAEARARELEREQEKAEAAAAAAWRAAGGGQPQHQPRAVRPRAEDDWEDDSDDEEHLDEFRSDSHGGGASAGEEEEEGQGGERRREGEAGGGATAAPPTTAAAPGADAPLAPPPRPAPAEVAGAAPTIGGSLARDPVTDAILADAGEAEDEDEGDGGRRAARRGGGGEDEDEDEDEGEEGRPRPLRRPRARWGA